jgi:uncharacterized protein YcbK (DUF882 family)
MRLTKENWETFAKEKGIKYFRFSEFVREDEGFIEADLVLKVEALRDYCGFPLRITSGFRSVQKNEEVGGANHSYHLRGMAVDISVWSFSPSMLYKLLKGAFVLGFGGIIVYPSHVHLDIREVVIFKVLDYIKKG